MSSTSCFTLRTVVVSAVLFIGSAPLPRAAAATDAPHAVIDIGPVVECRDATAPGFAATHPEEKIVAARFRISVLQNVGHDEDLEQLQLTISSPERRLRVVDFQPRTELSSELAGDVEVCRSDDTVKSVNASLGGNVGCDYGPTHAQASPAAGVGVTFNHGSKESFRRLAPKQLVLASGTTQAEHGVFFKWRNSTQGTLEGSREVTCQFVVPADWRGDWVDVTCDVFGMHRSYFGDRLETCGHARVAVGLYLAGDAEAEQAARQLSMAQARPSLGGASSPSKTQQYVAYKPVEAGHGSSEWFSLQTLFKPSAGNSQSPQQKQQPSESEGQRRGVDLPSALAELRTLAGTPK